MLTHNEKYIHKSKCQYVPLINVDNIDNENSTSQHLQKITGKEKFIQHKVKYINSPVISVLLIFLNFVTIKY